MCVCVPYIIVVVKDLYICICLYIICVCVDQLLNTQPQSVLHLVQIFFFRFVSFHQELFTFISASKCTNSFSGKCTELWILSSGKYFLYKNHLAQRLQIWTFLKTDQLYLQICLNIVCVSFHWSSKNVKAFIHVFEVSWKEPKIFTFFFSSRIQNVPRAG